MPHVPFLTIVAASTALDAIMAALALFVPIALSTDAPPATISLRRMFRTALATLAFFVVKGAFLATFGLPAFGWIHLIYIDLVILVPAIGTLLLIAARFRVGGLPAFRLTAPARVAAIGSLIMVPIGIDATWVEPFRLQLETAQVPVNPKRSGKDVIRIGVLTDLQTNWVTDYERSAVDRLMAEKPDVILLPGDVFQGSTEEFQATKFQLRQLLGRLSAPGGVYLVLGDTDGTGGHLLSEILPHTNVRLILNDVVRVAIGDRRMTIGGVELRYAGRPAQEVVEKLEGDEGDDDIRMLLAHRPDVALGLQSGSRIDLVVAGHTHGGQVVIPGFGPPMTLSSVPRNVAAGGLHEINGNPIYVSRGVGWERGHAPRIRFFCRPEISLLEVGLSDPSHD